MTRHTASILHVLTALLIMVFFSSCHWGNDEKEIIVMWETDESDLVFQKWSELLEEELDRQGINANVHYQYNRLGLTQEKFEVAKLRQLVGQLEAEGKGADLILAHGNYTEWLLCITADSLVRSVPAVCFGLKSEKFLPRMDKILERRNLTERQRVRMFDTLCLKENLDLADYIQNLPGMIVTKRYYSHINQTHRFISLLDRTSSWLDSLAVQRLDLQFDRLDKSRYYNNIMNDVVADTLNIENDRGKIVYSVYSLSNPETNVRVKSGPDAKMLANRASLLQVMSNIINNAIKFTEQGSITIGWEIESRDSGNRVVLFVEDTGIGISPENQQSIFKKYYKSTSTSAGAGIGLSLCKFLVEKMNGEISVKSTLGKGSRFEVRLNAD